MSTPTGTVAPEAAHEAEHHDAHEHPSDRKYVVIAVILAVLTAIEVGTYFFDDISTHWLVLMLIPIMVLKFGIVAAFFMHLKFDSPLFTRMFLAGLAFAVVVYCVMLTAFRFWD